jgi:uncharacterized phage protein gp47/JayE
MVTIRSTNEIILNLIDFFNTAQPNLDLKPGTVARDLIVDAPASQLALLYDEIGKISNLQSLRLVSGSDLDKLAQNYGVTRKVATKSSGTALLTFNSIPAIIAINTGSLITSTSGSTFVVLNGTSVDPANANFYKSIATKYQSALGFLNITDQYAVEVSVQATTAGSAGNISQYSLNQTSIPGVSNVTNTFPFTGGNDQENDSTFRNRVLAVFSGSNIGTALGYKNLVLSNSAVSDAVVIGPGNPLMTRDGTQVTENSDGSYTIISEGTGGKVDILILGSTLTQFTDTYIYIDQSNNNDPTNTANIIVLGQIAADANKTVTQKRIDDIANGVLPAQPVEAILQVTGSLSGGNFVPKTTDSLGRVSGNYELIKDTGVYAGSPWGFDKFHWVSNKISLFQEDRVKSKFNGQDATTYSDVIDIPKVQQSISIISENSIVSSSDSSIIQLLHTPATNVTRVFNVNTGETYTIINQNLDNTGSTNTTGQIQISGNTLPASSDILQVDYTWIDSYDPYSDYDGKLLNNNPRPISDSVDWGISNAIRNERVLFSLNTANNLFIGTVKHPVSVVISANYFSFSRGIAVTGTVANFLTRLQVVLSPIDNPINSIESIRLTDSNQEIYNTAQNDGIIINNSIVVGIQLKYSTTIILPTDTSAVIGDLLSITYNQQDSFNVVNSTGSFTSNQITIPASNISSPTQSIYLDVTYLAALPDLVNVGITGLPISRTGNGYLLNTNTGSTSNISSNTIKRENQTIQSNNLNQNYITLSIPSSDFSLLQSQIISVIDLVSNKEIWNIDFPGTVVNTGTQYQLIFSGFNSPAVGDNVLVMYFADDIRRFQPFTFTNQIIKTDFQNLSYNFTTNNFYVPIHNFIVENNMVFNVIDNTTGLSIASGTDGYIQSVSSNSSVATFSSISFNFSSVDDLLGKSLKLINTVNINNKGYYSITSINTSSNVLTIQLAIANLQATQVSVIGVANNTDLWTTSGTIDPVNNVLNLPANAVASQGDAVVVVLFGNKNLHQSPTKLSITVTDQISNSGVITASGTTVTQVANVVFTAINGGLTQNALSAFVTFLNLTTNATIPSNTYITRVVSVKKVSVTTGNQVLSTLATYDVLGTEINNNILYANEMITNPSLQNTQFTLPSTTNNINNSPNLGDSLMITFYYATDNDSENVYFTKNGTLYTNKKFAFLNRLYPSSGFNTSQSARFTVSFFTQPATGSRYTAFYDYLAPKQNERILINYNYNSLITNTTFTVEGARPITADVLIKEAKQLLIDATLNIVINSDSTNSAAIVIQNVNNAITSTINTNQLGGVLSSSMLISAAQAVDGVERVRVVYFNVDGTAGQVLTITAQENQYFVANTISIVQESITSG